MFTSLTSNFDLIIKVIALALFLLLLAYVGLGFVFRFAFKIFKIKFSHPNMESADNKILDLQLIRLYHGINLDSVSDIDLFAKAIISGKIQTPKRWLLPSCLPLGKTRMENKHSLFIYLLILLIVGFTVSFAGSTLKGQKYDYARFSDAQNYVLISNIYVLDPSTKKYYNKQHCNKLTIDDNEIVRTACDYILTNDTQMKEELHEAIRASNMNFQVVGIICSILYLIITCIFITYPRLQKINNEFYDFKQEEELPT
ncbi:UNVERIFIED_ORG: flagellar basal body-associated protein FliL [Buttiauxella agrestis ATCC 33320]